MIFASGFEVSYSHSNLLNSDKTHKITCLKKSHHHSSLHTERYKILTYHYQPDIQGILEKKEKLMTLSQAPIAYNIFIHNMVHYWNMVLKDIVFTVSNQIPI